MAHHASAENAIVKISKDVFYRYYARTTRNAIKVYGTLNKTAAAAMLPKVFDDRQTGEDQCYTR